VDEVYPAWADEQVATCCLDARNVPGLLGIPPIEHEKAWALVERLCVKVIGEVKGAEDAHTHYHTDDGTSDFKSTAAALLTAIHAAGNLRQHEGPSTRNMCM